MLKIYGDKISGNCLKVKYVCDLLGLSYEWIDVSVLDSETKTPEFLSVNPAGQVPAIRLDDGRVLAQSNAIMRFLADGSFLIPEEKFSKAKMDEWLCWEQYSHETAIAVTRFHVIYLGKRLEERDAVLVKKGEAALDYMEAHLQNRKWFVNESFSLADIALFAYTQFAPDAGFALSSRPQILDWLERVRAQLAL